MQDVIGVLSKGKVRGEVVIADHGGDLFVDINIKPQFLRLHIVFLVTQGVQLREGNRRAIDIATVEILVNHIAAISRAANVVQRHGV